MWERDGVFPAHELFKKIGDQGFLGITKPEQFGDYVACIGVSEPGAGSDVAAIRTSARKLDKLGMRASDTAEIHFDDVRVPQRYLIGEEGKGFIYQMQQFQEERLWGATSVIRYMEKAIEDCILYTRERQAFGQPLLDNRVIHFRMA